MAGGRAIGDHGHWLAGGMGGVELDFHIQYRGQATQALGTNAQRIDLVIQL